MFPLHSKAVSFSGFIHSISSFSSVIVTSHHRKQHNPDWLSWCTSRWKLPEKIHRQNFRANRQILWQILLLLHDTCSHFFLVCGTRQESTSSWAFALMLYGNLYLESDYGTFTLDFKQLEVCAAQGFLYTLGPCFKIKYNIFFEKALLTTEQQSEVSTTKNSIL